MLGLQAAAEMFTKYINRGGCRVLPVELPACPWNWSQKILASFIFSCANFSEDSEVGRSQGNSAGRNASVLGPGRSVDLSCASAGQTLPGSKEETAICKNLDWSLESEISCECHPVPLLHKIFACPTLGSALFPGPRVG
jgi:hypothetical protein